MTDRSPTARETRLRVWIARAFSGVEEKTASEAAGGPAGGPPALRYLLSNHYFDDIALPA
jgi:hypothetical protein